MDDCEPALGMHVLSKLTVIYVIELITTFALSSGLSGFSRSDWNLELEKKKKKKKSFDVENTI